MLADLLLPFPISHPSTVPSDLIHPPLRYGIPLPPFPPPPRPLLNRLSSTFFSCASRRVFLLVQLIETALYSSFRPLLSVLPPSTSRVVSPFLPLRQSRSPSLLYVSPPPFSTLFLSPSASHPDANDITAIVVSNEYTGRCTRTRYSVGIIH